MKKRYIIPIFLMVALLPCVLHAAFPAPYSKSLDLTVEDKSITLKNGSKLKIEMQRPMKPLKSFIIKLNFEKGKNVKSLSATSNMEMNMGVFDSNIKRLNDNTFSLEQTLVRCKSGRTMWYTHLIIEYIDKSVESVYFFYDVK